MDWYVLAIYLPWILALTFTLFGFLIRRKFSYNLLPDKSGGRHIHKDTKLRIGGIGIIIIFIVGLIVGLGLDFLVWSEAIGGIILASLIVLVYGFLDEKYDLSWKHQLIIQTLVVIVVIMSGIGIEAIMLPSNELWFFGQSVVEVWGFSVPIVKIILTFLWIVGLMNVVNWLDGVDGLAAGVGSIGFLFFALLSLQPYVLQYEITFLSLTLMVIFLGFLRFNFYPSKIFLGTYGSMFLGLMLAVLAIFSGGKVATAVLVLAFPIIDAIFVVWGRLMSGKSVFKADNRHFHHKLLKAGLTQRQVVLVLYAVSCLFGVFALVFQTQGKVLIFGMAVILMVGVSLGLSFWGKKNV
jgi:UDP-GlcNAc:undecaprenyl-phosphate GlcNAc-1-phosphate transferase